MAKRPDPNDRGRRLETLVQMHSYFRQIANHSESVGKIISTIEEKILGILNEG